MKQYIDLDYINANEIQDFLSSDLYDYIWYKIVDERAKIISYINKYDYPYPDEPDIESLKQSLKQLDKKLDSLKQFTVGV